MTQQTDAWQEDVDYLLEQHPDASEETQDEFAERVSIMIIDGGLELERARTLALNWIRSKYKL